MNIIPLLLIDYFFGMLIDLDNYVLIICNLFVYAIVIYVGYTKHINFRKNSIVIALLLAAKNIFVFVILHNVL